MRREPPGPVPFVHSGFERRKNDHYPTIDERCVRALTETWDIGGVIVDPCSPQGSGIVDTLRDMVFNAHAAPTVEEVASCDWIVTNPPYTRGIVDEIARAILKRVASDQVRGAALLMRANWDLAQGRADLFKPPWYAGQTRMRFRPWWSEDRTAQPIHSYCWLVWQRHAGEPVVRYWPAD